MLFKKLLYLIFFLLAGLAFALQNNATPIELLPEVIAVYPHDPAAFTQGLLLFEGLLYESTGRYGQSSVRQVELPTGTVRKLRKVSDEFFGEGLARVGERLIQLTWKSGLAFVYDLRTFELLASFNYEGQGWGLCFDGETLFMSDGSSTLFRRNPDTFAIKGQIPVVAADKPVNLLNELECVGDYIYANVWRSNLIVKIDKTSGTVLAVIDAGNLLSKEEQSALRPGAVLNGIAYNPQKDSFFITGKL